MIEKQAHIGHQTYLSAIKPLYIYMQGTTSYRSPVSKRRAAVAEKLKLFLAKYYVVFSPKKQQRTISRQLGHIFVQKSRITTVVLQVSRMLSQHFLYYPPTLCSTSVMTSD